MPSPVLSAVPIYWYILPPVDTVRSVIEPVVPVKLPFIVLPGTHCKLTFWIPVVLDPVATLNTVLTGLITIVLLSVAAELMWYPLIALVARLKIELLPNVNSDAPVSYTHLTLPTNREV